MQWARGLFRFWVLLSFLWLIGVTVVNYNSVTQPYIKKASYIFSSDLSVPPLFAEEYSDPYTEAVALKEQGQAVRYEIKKDGVLRETEIFFSNTTSPEDAVDRFDAILDIAVAKQAERISIARKQNLIEAVAAGFLPPLGLLVLGVAIGWALKGFQRNRQPG